MCRPLPIQSLEIAPVAGQNRASQRVGTGKDVRIGCRSSAILLGCHNVIAKPAQFFDYGEGEIFIGVEHHPRSLHGAGFAFLVFPDVAVDFLPVGVGIFQAGLQVRQRQPLDGPEDVGVGCTELPIGN